jgi:hypothetical protein
MKRMILTMAIMTMATSAHAGPLGICSPRGTGPVRKVAGQVRTNRPVATATAQTVSNVRAVVEVRPVMTAVRNVVECVGGVCGIK